MRRWLVSGAAWGLVSSACALDMGGLGPAADLAQEDGGASSNAMEDATDEESVETSLTGQDAQGSSSPDAPLSSESGTATDGATGDVSIPDASGDSGMSVDCDQDGDGHQAIAAPCGGDDCCDTDAHVHPGETAYYTTPGNCGGFDYDCDGKDTPEYGGASCSWNTFSCSGDGFQPPVPGCGVFGTFTSCSIPWYDPLTCDGSNQSQAQACR
jgi:hypothetical protein